MSKYLQAALVAGVTPFASGALYVDRQVTDLADRTIFPANVANADQIQIGVVPAGSVLVPHLTAIRVPRLDTNGAATGKFKIGTESVLDAVAAEQNGNAAVTLSGEDLALFGATVGSPTEDTPIFLNASAAVATLGTGKVILDLALRAWNDVTDKA